MNIAEESSQSTFPKQSGTPIFVSAVFITSHPSTLSAAVSRARMSATQDSGLAWKASEAGSGLRCIELLGSLDLESCSLKTSQLSLAEDWLESCVTLPPSGMTRSGTVYRLDTSARRTSANESSYLPTPTKAMGQRGWGLSRSGRGRYSQGVIVRAFQFGYKPPVALLEWMMGYPVRYTANESEPLETA